ncbi:PHB depolymerase family esterase [uncultured Eudoraea sp.]|uniref:carboxylesterase family protein n=1 Tax=uncultured Eudoraea sp. TaxID=1035614 RepID=UPI00261A326B|nr:PHB depolymerase family esterase [uncultured Eudoraea sp.]
MKRILSVLSKTLALLSLVFIHSCSAQSQLIADEKETISVEKMQYYLYYPKEYEVEKDKKFPLLLFLHGGGESGGKLEDLKTNGPPKLLAEGKEFPFLILAPQNPYQKKWWNTRAVIQLLDTIVENNRVDLDRVYLTGLSRGGSAAWEIAVQYPDKFAAMAVVCGMTPVPYASWINKNMPIWVFHGAEDKSIPVTESDEMVSKLKQMGYNVTFTRYEGVGHNAWTQAYTTEALYEWFINQKRLK